ncbi:11695_t:CDS:1, partial [Ambispora gerdemannii]
PDCGKEVESVIDSMPGSQNINNLIDISPNLFIDSQLYSSSPKKRVSESTSKSSSKKVKKQVRKEDSPILKKLISELSTDTSKNAEILQSKFSLVANTINFLNLYQKIIESEDINKKTSQDVILCYFHLEDRFNHYRKNNPKRTAQGLVNNEVRTQIPESVSESLLRKTKERAQKIYCMISLMRSGLIKSNEFGLLQLQQ